MRRRQRPDEAANGPAFAVFAVTLMLVFYALEDRGPSFVLAFVGACLLASLYGFLQGAWPFGVVEAIRGALASTAGGSGSSRVGTCRAIHR